MPKYLKSFETHSQYVAFTQTEDFILPNICYCEDQTDVVHYNDIETRIIATFNLQSAKNTSIYYLDDYNPVPGVNMFSDIEIDGVSVNIADLDTAQGMYNLSSGQHTVAYTLINSSEIPHDAFNYCTDINTVSIPEGVITINSGAFNNCTSLVTVTLPSSIEDIRSCSFSGCENLNQTSAQAIIDINEDAFTCIE